MAKNLICQLAMIGLHLVKLLISAVPHQPSDSATAAPQSSPPSCRVESPVVVPKSLLQVDLHPAVQLQARDLLIAHPHQPYPARSLRQPSAVICTFFCVFAFSAGLIMRQAAAANAGALHTTTAAASSG